MQSSGTWSRGASARPRCHARREAEKAAEPSRSHLGCKPLARPPRLPSDVLRQGRLADAVGTDDDDIGGLLEEVERHQRLDGGSVAALGPVPVEVAQRLEAADMSGLQP